MAIDDRGVVVLQPFIQIGLQSLDGLVDLIRNVIW